MVSTGVRGPLPLRPTSISQRRFCQIGRHRGAAEQQDAVIVEIFVAARRAEALEIFRRGIGVEVHREQLALDQIGLGRLAQPDGHVGLAHREVELLVGGDQREMDVGIKLEEFAEPRREPMHADAGRGGHVATRRSAFRGCR